MGNFVIALLASVLATVTSVPADQSKSLMAEEMPAGVWYFNNAVRVNVLRPKEAMKGNAAAALSSPDDVDSSWAFCEIMVSKEGTYEIMFSSPEGPNYYEKQEKPLPGAIVFSAVKDVEIAGTGVWLPNIWVTQLRVTIVWTNGKKVQADSKMFRI